MPLGIKLLCYIYRVNVVLFILSLLLFYNRILILGQEVNIWLSGMLKLVLIFVPAYLSFKLKQLKKDAWVMAICFHALFIINNMLAFLEYGGHINSLFRITGIYSSTIYSPSEIFVIGLHNLINLSIIWYLFIKRKMYFLKKTGVKR